jgi:hypothetical protein
MALALDLEQHLPNESFQIKLRLEVDDIDEVTNNITVDWGHNA